MSMEKPCTYEDPMILFTDMKQLLGVGRQLGYHYCSISCFSPTVNTLYMSGTSVVTPTTIVKFLVNMWLQLGSVD